MSIKAMKQALNALVRVHVADNDCDFLNDSQCNQVTHAIDALRTAIQQAEAKTDEPVAWVVMNGLSKYQVCGSKDPADALCAEMQKRHDLSGSLAAFHVQPLYTHPAPGVPDDVVRDAERYRWLCESLGQTQLPTLIERITAGYVADYKPSIDDAIDAAMLAASPAQKCGE